MAYESLLKQAVADFNAGRVEVAREALHAITELDPMNELAWLWYAHSLQDAHKAIAVLRQYLALNPDSVEAQKRLNIYLHAQGVDEGVAQDATRGHPSQLQAVTENGASIGEAEGKSRASSIPELLEMARQDLLDLGMRNPLLNYRLYKARGLELSESDVQGVFDALVQDDRTLSFAPLPEPEEGTEVAEVDSADDEVGALAFDGRRRVLQTQHPGDDLDKRLLNTYYVSRTYMEEQGVNVLFLAFGMLRWYEAPSSDVERLAPLVLVPVAIDRADIRSQFSIVYTEEEVGFNLSLQSKLKSDFGLTLPDLPDEPELKLDGYFDAVAAAMGANARWQVDRSMIALGFFSFATFLMYNDLLEESWSGVQDLTAHPILQALLGDTGFDHTADPLPDDLFIDDLVDPTDTRYVLDADSSQTAALLEVECGQNLVIEGPPGTGKSQTITNLIAESLGQGKRVLFVAEKMAALEVVKRRLDTIGLGKACLELHSHKTQKRAVLADLQETLNLDKPRVQDHAIDIAKLVNTRDQLNAYSEAVNTPIGESMVSPYQCYGHLLRLGPMLEEAMAPSLGYGQMPNWTRTTYAAHRDVVGELEALLGRMGVPAAHPFWAAYPPALTPASRRRFLDQCATSRETLSTLQSEARCLSDALGIDPTGDHVGTLAILAAAQQILDGPDVSVVRVVSAHWYERAAEIQAALQAAQRLEALHRQFDALLTAQAWSEDVGTIIQHYAAHGHKWWRLTVSEYRQARAALALLCDEKLPRGVDRQRAALEAIQESQHLVNVVSASNDMLADLFGVDWCAAGTDWMRLQHIADWLYAVYRDISSGELPATIVTYLAKGPVDRAHLEDQISQIQKAVIAHSEAIEQTVTALQLDEVQRFDGANGFLGLSYADQAGILQDWAANVDRIQEITIYNRLVSGLGEAGLSELTAVAAHWSRARDRLVMLYDRTWYEGLLDRAIRDRTPLREFDRDIHHHRVMQFCDLDRLQFQYNCARLADRHWRYLPSPTGDGQMGVLLHEFEKKRRHLPIRKLMIRAGRAVQALKPVFMMSPLSIAAYLPPGSVDFDLVIFDEASQVKPADALGAILRGEQVVVTGDSKQLPPTSFFETIVEPDEDEESPTADLESILGMFRAQGAARKMLKWHYRSRHPSLIAVSNYEFYENSLLVFPSPDNTGDNDGLVLRYLPDAVYDRGKSRTNPREAQAVAEAVMHHARTRPGWTLGVAAFSMSQSRAIRDQVEMLRRQHPECEPFFKDHGHEPFFVKNLENVQGDERDVILISVGYGHDANGKLTMNFGPINKDGGERRLNVLITRARHRCEVFSGIKGEDIDLGRTQADGVRALKRFLTYADGHEDLQLAEPSGHEPDSVFERDVRDVLTERGYAVDSQVGSAGFFIDLAIKHRLHSGRYVLGIECDGATYHSARSARDRDRLRQEVLEGLGWTIYRIWSTDWFNHRPREIEQLIAVVEAALENEASERDPLGDGDGGGVQHNDAAASAAAFAYERAAPQVGAAPALEIRRVAASRPQAAELVQLYQRFRGKIHYRAPLHEAPPITVSRWVEKVVKTEGPLHIDVLMRRITYAAGSSRVGTRIQRAIRAGVARAQRDGHVVQKGGFVWPAGMAAPPVRDRSALPTRSRKIELVAPEEIAEAIKLVVRSSVGIMPEDIPAAACGRLGFGRAGALIVAAVEDVMACMLKEGSLTKQNGYIVLGETQ